VVLRKFVNFLYNVAAAACIIKITVKFV
jgi:hypothetical protein